MNAKYGGYDVTYIDAKKAVWFKVIEGVRGFNQPAKVIKDPNTGKYTITSLGILLTIVSQLEVEKPEY